jgi:hypothetical protein
MGPSETRSTVRRIADQVEALIPTGPATPKALAAVLCPLFSNHPSLAEAVAGELTDSIAGHDPRRDELLAMAADHGIDVDRFPTLLKGLEEPRRKQARAIADRAAQLGDRQVVPASPAGLRAPREPTSGRDRTSVPHVVVGEAADRRKRTLGDDGEQWALAAVVGPIVALLDDERSVAIDAIIDLLGRYHGGPVENALGHAELARASGLDEEDLIDELAALVHVSRYSDAFGFDLVG